MTTIKKGDKLRVLSTPSNNSKLTIGEIVTAAADQRDGGVIDIEKNGNTTDYRGFYTYRFEIVQDTPTEKVDFTKPVQTRDGRSITLVTTQGRGLYPVLAYVGDNASVTSFTAEGVYYIGDVGDMDIINVPKKPAIIEHYFNMYADGTIGSKFSTRAEADQRATTVERNMGHKRIGVQKVAFTEGVFDA